MSGFIRTRVLVGAVTLALVGWVSASQAAVMNLTDPVSGQYSGWQVQWDDQLNPTISIVVDSVSGNTVVIEKQAEFHGAPPGGITPIAITFVQTQPTNVTNIVIEDERLFNGNGVTWTDFHMDIADSGDANFNVAATNASAGGAGFNIFPFTQRSFGNSGSGPNTSFDVSGGPGVPAGQSWTPGTGPQGDGQLWMSVNPHAQAPFTVFTLKERPTIPEPASLSLLAIGGLALLGRKR